MLVGNQTPLGPGPRFSCVGVQGASAVAESVLASRLDADRRDHLVPSDAGTK